MSKTTLGGTLIVHNGNKLDYCWRESIQNLQAFCDQVVVVEIGSDDNTDRDVKKFEDYKTTIINLPKEAWAAQEGKGKEKLNYFTNKAIAHLETDYNFNLQADEIVSEKSFQAIRDVINTGFEGFMVKRLNLWFDAYHVLNCELSRMPCSPYIIRLAKTKYQSTGDAESLDVPNVNMGVAEQIRIFHMGFVRKMDVMKVKVSYMQKQVFEMTNHDPRLDEDIQFNPDRYFDRAKDAVPLIEPLPRHIKEWAEERWGLAPT